MKKETVKTILSVVVGCIGGFLIGFNAGKLDNTVNAILFVLGIAVLSSSTLIVSLIVNGNKRKK